MSKPTSRVLNFMGFGGKKRRAEDDAEGEKPEDKKESKASEDDEEEEDEDKKKREDEDDDPDAAKDEDTKKEASLATARREAVAGERRRIAAIMNGVDPAKAQLALHFALNTGMAPAQVAEALAVAPSGGKASPFVSAMTEFSGNHGTPGFGGGGPAKGPSLSARMSQTLGLDKSKR